MSKLSNRVAAALDAFARGKLLMRFHYRRSKDGKVSIGDFSDALRRQYLALGEIKALGHPVQTHLFKLKPGNGTAAPIADGLAAVQTLPFAHELLLTWLEADEVRELELRAPANRVNEVRESLTGCAYSVNLDLEGASTCEVYDWPSAQAWLESRGLRDPEPTERNAVPASQ